jgi:hypothetical protein
MYVEMGFQLNLYRQSFLFNIVINTPTGALYVGEFSRKGGDEVVGGATSKAPNHNIKKAHELLGHNNENDTRQMASHLGWTITRGPLGVCESCANAKARQKHVPKISTGEKATVINGRWFHDSSTLKVHKGEKGSSKIWDPTFDELTGIPFTGIYNKKNEFIESMYQRMQAQTARGYPVLIMRQDNAWEIKKLEKRLQSAYWKLPIKMEYTAANTPQQNALVEVKFTYLAAKGRVAMHAAEVPRDRRLEFFPELIMTMTKLDWLKLITIKKVKKTRIEHYGLPLPNFTQYLCNWGEAETIKTDKDGKIGDRGVTGMFVGYASNHEGECYRMWNPKTKKVSKTCDVVFLNRMFFRTPTMPVHMKQSTDDEDLDSVQQDERGGTMTADFATNDNHTATVESVDSSVPDTPVVNNNLGQSKYGCTYRCTTHYDPTTGRTIGTEATALANYYQCLEEMDGEMEFANIVAGIGGGFKNTMELKPMKYKEAINGPDGKAREKEIENEHDCMVKNNVWEPVNKSLLPKGTKVIDSTWACKKKSTGKLRGRLNAHGFKQVEGVHYDGTSTHAPVTNAGTIRIVLILMIMADWQGQIVDVKGVFLHGKFKDGKVIYMKVPCGFEKFYPDEVVLKLKKCIYGLKQATMAFWRKLLLCMKSIGMMWSTADPCLYHKWGEEGLVLIVSWIDDNLIIGSKKVVEKTKKDIMERFDCKDCGDIEEYMGCKIVRTKNLLKFTQPVLMQSYNDEFELPKMSYRTPAPAGSVLVAGKK